VADNLLDAFAEAGIAPPSKDGKPEERPDPGWTLEKAERRKRPPGYASRRVPPCPVEADEIRPGLVAWLDPAILIGSGRMMFTVEPPVKRAGWFVCIAVDGFVATFAGLTTNPGEHLVRLKPGEQGRLEPGERGRLAIKPEWRSGGTHRWRTDPQFLTDGTGVWHGDKDVFARATHRERCSADQRARITGKGIAAVRQEVENLRGRRFRLLELTLSRRTETERR